MCSDPLRFRQILVNLLGNAIKFTEAGEVAVRVACDPAVSENQQPSLRIDVRDTGIGMNGEQVSNLFRPFTQADETTTRRFGGTGLGLAITHRLVNLLGGNIDVNSEAGFGSTFRIVLPVRAVADGPPSDETGDAQSMAQPDSFIATRLRGSILIVEDTPDTQRLLMMLLATAGAQVSVAGNGRVGVELATTAATPFDVIVMDMQMPEMDGYAAATELRRRGVRAPIIALTAHAMAGDRERCIDAGCNDYLTKPIDVPLLLRTIARHLDATRAAVAAKVA
jgi:two-component system CheB/CheR fusion protein